MGSVLQVKSSERSKVGSTVVWQELEVVGGYDDLKVQNGEAIFKNNLTKCRVLLISVLTLFLQ